MRCSKTTCGLTGLGPTKYLQKAVGTHDPVVLGPDQCLLA